MSRTWHSRGEGQCAGDRPGRLFAARVVAAVSVIGLVAGCATDAEPPAATEQPTAQAPTTAPPTPTPTPSPSITVQIPRPTDTPTPTPTTDYAPGQRALDVLETLEVKGRAPRTGYDRDAFGWRSYDFDRNGCDSRNDILGRDLISVTYRPGSNDCTVESGTLLDPFTATVIPFERGGATSNDVQIDHVVALNDAWQKGAQQWPELTLVEFGNDPLNLLAVDGPANQQKGHGDAATWLPPNREFRCEYVARQIAVKVKYELWVTQAEKTAMVNVLADCPQQELPDDGKPTQPSRFITNPSPGAPQPSVPVEPPEPQQTTTGPSSISGPVRPNADGSCPDDAPIKGNQGRNGWIFHVRGSSPNYNQTKAEQCFASTADAEAGGYRAPRR